MAHQTFYVRDSYGNYTPAEGDAIIAEAKRRVATKYRRGTALHSPAASREKVEIELADLEHETFACLFLDNRHRIIAFERLFNGTIDGASVYPREVVKKALAHNAAAVIFAHNHPSGQAEPSPADRNITSKLKQALALMDVRVLDHFVIGHDESFSFAEHGLL